MRSWCRVTIDTTTRVVNTHWFGGVDKLPSNTVYIGRPSEYGNRYSSKSGLYTREECIALNRVDLYQSLIKNPAILKQWHEALAGHDLACWCKQHKRVVGCHGDNYVHIFSPELMKRSYDKSVVQYLMEDLRSVLAKLKQRVNYETPNESFLFPFIHLGDVIIDIQYVLLYCRENFIAVDDLQFFIARIVIDLELALIDQDIETMEYRFSHVCWTILRFMRTDQTRSDEPQHPHDLIKRGASKGKVEEVKVE
jgi:hypothetical protein